jgi:glycosyltransferase involved in cell wall biosynthesis
MASHEKKIERILLVGHSYLAEENRKQLDALGRFLEVEVLSPSSWREGMSHYCLEVGVHDGKNHRIRFLEERRMAGLPQSQYFLPELGSIVRDFRPDLVHVESDPWTSIAAQAIRIRNRTNLGIPVVCTAKQNTYTTRGALRDFFKQRIANWGIRNTARFIGVSEAVRTIYEQRFGVDADRFDITTHLGVDTELFRPVEKGMKTGHLSQWAPSSGWDKSLVVGYCGRLEAYKGITDLLEAVEIARDTVTADIRLIALGSGGLGRELCGLANTLDWFHVVERVPHFQVAGFMKAIDLFVMPSRKSIRHEEHDAHAVLEALSSGLPCIGTDSGVIPSVLKQVGEVVPAAEPEVLAKSLARKTMEYPNKNSNQVNLRGREKIIAHYSLEAVAEKNLESYSKATDSWRAQAQRGISPA